VGRRLSPAELDERGRRRCGRCGRIKPLEEFNRDRSGRSGYGYRCKPCARAATRVHQAANSEGVRLKQAEYRSRPDVKARTRDRLLRAKYGVSAEEYDRILAQQGGTCAICSGSKRDSRSRELPVDHDHTTGSIRGILCDPCNRTLGLFGDDPGTLRAAARYLRKWARRQ
jgi:hypothetical protein